MKHTNKMGLPSALFKALSSDTYSKAGQFSASELSGPPQIRTLRKRYSDVMEVDVSDLIYPLIGNNVHYILEKAGIKNSLTEEQLVTTVGKFKVSGRFDLYEENNDLWDYKITTRWVLIDGVKTDWEAQCNINSFLLQIHGFPVNKIKICAIFRDWSKIQSIKDPEYPKNQVAVMEVEKWDMADIEDYIVERCTIHSAAEVLLDSALPNCTPEERWEKPTIYAIMKKGRKSSLRNLHSFEEAQKYIKERQLDTNTHSIQTRLGESTRCEYYCDVKDYCKQYQKMKDQNENNFGR